MKKRKKKTGIITLLICILAIFGGLLFFLGTKEEKSKSLDSQKASEMEEAGDGTIEINIQEIPGFITGGEESTCGLELPYQIPGTALTIERIGQYSGEFVEDGSSEPSANVLSLVVRNDSNAFVEYADITFTVNDSEQASFEISGVPANKYVLVMEKGKREFNSEDTLVYETQLYAERGDVSLKDDMIKVSTADGELTAENISKTPLEAVYIRYKTKILPECYLGGITYSCTIEELADGEEKSAKTGHFSDKFSEIVMVETVEK